MGKSAGIVLLLLLLLVPSTYAGEYKKGPWSFRVDEGKAILSVSHTRLGPVLTGVRLQSRRETALFLSPAGSSPIEVPQVSP